MTPRELSDSVDIAIIGGGVAGSSAAIVLQQEGFSTLVVEREAEFKDRVRGEACHPWGVLELTELGLRPLVDRASAIDLPIWTTYHDGEIHTQFHWEETFPGAPAAIGFNHPRLQETMLLGAERVGSRVYRPARTNAVQHSKGWLIHIQPDAGVANNVQARFLIAADGKRSVTRRLWGAEQVDDPANHEFGGILLRGINLPEDSAHQIFHNNGFFMVYPQGEGIFRLYEICTTEIARSFSGGERVHHFLERCRGGFPAGSFDDVEPLGPLAFFPNNHVGTTRIAGRRAVALGDAAGAPDPTQGHGMALLWRDVRTLRDVLRSSGFDEAPGVFEGQRRSYEHVLRTHAAWVAPLIVRPPDLPPALEAQVDAAREMDPTALGYAGIFANGPDNLPTDDEARAIFFGEHLAEHPLHFDTPLDKLS